MPQECANFVSGFGRQDVLELAGLLLDFGLAIHGKAVSKQALGQSMAADDVCGALATARSELDNRAAVPN